MSDINDELKQALTSLTNEGKELSVAKIKARLTTSLPIPVIIQALQAWKKNQRIPEITTTSAPMTPEMRITELEAQIQKLTKRIEQLEAKNNDK